MDESSVEAQQRPGGYVGEVMHDTHEMVFGSLLETIGPLDAPQSDADLMEILERVLDSALNTVHADDGSLLVRDDETDELVFALVQGKVPTKDLLWRRLTPGQGIAGWVVRNRKTAVVNHPVNDRRFYCDLDKQLHFNTRSLMAAPIIGGGEVLGVIEVLNKRDNMPFTSKDEYRISQMCKVAGDLLHAMICELDKRDP